MINKENLRKIISVLKIVIKEEKLDISDEVLFSEATSYHRGIIAGKSRANEGITENQYNFIKKNEADLLALGFDLNNIQTKSDAFKVISEYKKMRENEKTRK